MAHYWVKLHSSVCLAPVQVQRHTCNGDVSHYQGVDHCVHSVLICAQQNYWRWALPTATLISRFAAALRVQKIFALRFAS